MPGGAVISQPIRLRAEDEGQKVHVEPADKERYTMLVRQVLEACHLYSEQLEKGDLFRDEVLPHLQTWVAAHSAGLAGAFLALRDKGLLFAIMCDGPYDRVLEDPLTELDIDIAERFPDFSLDVLELPRLGDEDLVAFVPRQRFDFEIRRAK